MSQGIIVTDYRLENGFDSQQGQRIFLLAPASRLALWPTQPCVQWVLGVLSPGVKRGQVVTLTTHPHLVLRSRMSGSYTSSTCPKHLHCVSWRQLYFISHSAFLYLICLPNCIAICNYPLVVKARNCHW
jgi:hypothetical protein